MTRRVALRRKGRVARATSAFAFEKPPGFAFKAGQALDLMLPDPPRRDDLGARRTFSIVSAPCENELVVATRIRDTAFKECLEALEVGACVEIVGPSGSLTLHRNVSRPAVFIAGGIGITPFVSLLRQAAHDRREQVLTLLYSNRQPDDAAFLKELSEYERVHRGTFSMRATITGALQNGVAWQRDRGRIDAALIDRVIVKPSMPMFYVAGPPSMVSGVRDVLDGMGIRDEDIRSEDFLGY